MSSTMDSYTLKSVLDLPTPFRSAFSFRYFNSLQSECFPVCFHTDLNMVVSAPTGSGKTVLFELCILRLLSRFISEGTRFTHAKGTLKTIYVAPSKALVQEKLRHWGEKFGSWGVNCLEMTGDNESYNIRNVQEADIILTTPEKFDAVTRYGIRDGGLSFFSDIALLLIDEVHLLNDPRGAALEAIVSRIKMLARKPEMKSSSLAHVRLLAVSATIPNVEDLAEWLEVPPRGIKRFGEEMRPVKLTTKVFGYTPAKNDFLFEKRLQNYIFDILMLYAKGKSALVFCSTRKGAQEAAQRLSQSVMTLGYSNPFIKDRDQQERLREASLSCSDKQMQSYIIYGVGYHNGGVSLKDRNLIESLFLKGDVQILCTTNTLAHGINLPAHTVVIKSTQHFNKEKGQYMEYDRSTILQMSGRAGRPPFDDTGMVIIMTKRDTVHLYQNLLNGCEMVESQLLPCLTEHLTAEIVQLNVSDITRTIEWMKSSYLYVRMKKNPGNYAVKKAIASDRLEKHLQEVCVQKVNELSRHQMIWTDEDGFLLKPLEPGRLMTRYYLKFDTMKLIMQAPTDCSLEDALNVTSRAEEISWIQLRRNEKKLLNDINTDKDARLRFHVLSDNGKRKKRIQTREDKIFVLVNDCLTGDPSIHDLSLTQDMNSACSNGCRISKCMKEYFIYKKNYKGALNSALLAKSLYQKLWDDSPYLLKQLPGIGMVTAKALHSVDIKSFETLAEADPRRIEIVTGRKFPFGNQIKDSLLTLPPKVEMKLVESESERRGKSKLVLTLTKISEPFQSTKRHYADMIVGSEEDNLIVLHEKISPYSTVIHLSNPQQGKLTVKADFVFEEYIGIDLHQKLTLTRFSNVNSANKKGKLQFSSLAPPQELCIIEDNDEPSRSTVKKLHNSSKSRVVDDSIPSFNLLDEFDDVEDDPVVEVNEDQGKVITGQKIFDHIREKAKSFPELAPSSAAYPPSTETLNLARKRAREKQLEYLELEAVEQIERSLVARGTLGKPSIESEASEKNGLHIEKSPSSENHTVGKSSIAFDFLQDKDKLSLEPEVTIIKPLTEATIFDHIRHKSKDFPLLNEMQTQAETLNEKNERWASKHLEFGIDRYAAPKWKISDDDTEDLMIISDSETKEFPNYRRDSRSGKRVKHNLHPSSAYSPKLPVTDVDPRTTQMLSFDSPMLKSDNVKVTNKDGSTKSMMKHHSSNSPAVPQSHRCSTETPAKANKVQSFLGFESVFSFL